MIKGQEFVYSRLSGDTVITSLVGSRIYYGWQEETAEFPLVTFFEVSSTPRPTRNTFEESFQIDVWDYASAGTALDAVAERIVRIFDFSAGATGVVCPRVSQVRETFEGDLRRKSIDISIVAVL